MKAKIVTLIIIAIVGLTILFSSFFVVTEGQKALIMRLGEINTNKQGQSIVYGPGLHIKSPIISSALIFDTRLQTLEIEKSRIVTSQKKDVIVDYYVKWRISDLDKFYTSTGGNKMQAEQLLAQQVNNGLRAEFGRRGISDVVSDDRSQIMTALRTTANESAVSLGIEVIDVRIKAIDLPDEVSVAVFNRMRAERERVAAQHRAEGRSQAEAISAQADADVTVILAKAKQQAASMMAQGDQQAASIYAKAYGSDPSFYAFYRSLQAYSKAFSNKQDVLVLSPDSQFFRYFNSTADK